MRLNNFLYRITHWETWHHHVKYIPLAPVWIWYCIRSRTPWFFTGSNPTLTFGGFEGEGKKEMYEQLPPGTYPHSIYLQHTDTIEKVMDDVTAAGFNFPFIAKPDVGMMGFMVRKISTREQLIKYHNAIGVPYIIQTLVDYPIEVAAFYYRLPGARNGTTSGLLVKRPAYVTGNGKDNLLQLINANQHIRFKIDDVLSRNAEKLNDIIPDGEIYNLSIASNRSQAGMVAGAGHEINESLQKLLDEWSLYSGNLYYGRYDIKCASVESLKAGKDFYILEFNGAGAGIQHITGNNYSLFKAMGIILTHWKMMYTIAKLNHNNGVKRWGVVEGWKHLKAAKKNLLTLKKLDASFPSF